MEDFIAQVRNAMLATGITPPEELLFDDVLHRFSSNGKARDDSGYYQLAIDETKPTPFAYGYFGSWRDDIKESWHSKAAEKEWVREAASKNKRRQQEETKARNNKRAADAVAIYGKSEAINSDNRHEYLIRKEMRTPGQVVAKVYKDALVFAMRNESKEIRSLQFISKDSEGNTQKRFLSGASTKGLYCAFGKPPSTPGERIYIAEGPATADAVAQISKCLTVCAFSSANLAAVAKIISNKFPASQVVIAGDPGNVGEEKSHAAALAVNGLVTIPPAEEQISDWNDALLELGLSSARELFESRLQEPTLVKKEETPTEDSPPVGEKPEPVKPSPPSLPEPQQPVGDDRLGHWEQEWRQELIMIPAGKGAPEKVASNEHNVVLFAANHPDFLGCLAKDEMTGYLVFREYPYWYGDKDTQNRPLPCPLTDNDFFIMGCQLQKLGISMAPNRMYSGLVRVAESNPIHPLREKLKSIEWDNTERISSWLIDYCGAEDNPLNREYGKRFLISAIARIMRPGCQVDSALILEGRQGVKKSTLCKILSYDYFTDEHLNMQSKESAITIRGNWFVEMAELTALKRSDVETIKSYLTRRIDKIRPPYGKTTEATPRQNVFIGTTNADVYLNDDSGNRRFWPIRIESIDIDGITNDRDQLWAEAVLAYAGGEQWWLTDEMAALSIDDSKDRVQVDTISQFIEAYLLEHGLQAVTVSEVIINCLAKHENNPGQQKEFTNSRVGSALKKLGWRSCRNCKLGHGPSKFGIRPTIYICPDARGKTRPETINLPFIRNLRMHPDWKQENFPIEDNVHPFIPPTFGGEE